MKKLIYLTLLIPLSFISINCLGQGEILQKGTSGFGIDVNFSTGEGTSGFGAGIGFSISGIVDLQFAFAIISFPEEDFGNDFRALALSPGLAIHVLKQTEEIPVSLRLTASYGIYNYSGDMLSDYDLEMKGSALSLGLGVYHQLRIWSKASIIPTIDAIYSNTKATVSDLQGYSEEDTDEFVTILISLPFVFDLPQENVLYLTPQISFSNEITTFGITIGTVIPFNMSAPMTEDYEF